MCACIQHHHVCQWEKYKYIYIYIIYIYNIHYYPSFIIITCTGMSVWFQTSCFWVVFFWAWWPNILRVKGHESQLKSQAWTFYMSWHGLDWWPFLPSYASLLGYSAHCSLRKVLGMILNFFCNTQSFHSWNCFMQWCAYIHGCKQDSGANAIESYLENIGR